VEVLGSMAERDFGDYFISDTDEDLVEDDEDIVPPVVLPAPAAPVPSQVAPMAGPPSAVEPPMPAVAEAVAPVVAASPAAAPAVQAPSAVPQPSTAQSAEPGSTEPVFVHAAAVLDTPVAAVSAGPAGHESREARLARALNDLMTENVDIQAAALVSLDGFTMASALPEGMHEDRVGAMSAAILGLGERAAAELGRGALSQVFIEGAGGYVVLIAAGSRAVLTALADSEAKLGLVLYDMRDTAEEITAILG
jgi:predicted regulator of Ras-like GTPase activity (Roadblock/LC7/MglB family)